ncbi:MAG: hypothetical protein EXS00_00155 [Phycisphaerales bacterium]|nr:hypothetical protein [Phycisphaerales bacterium]
MREPQTKHCDTIDPSQGVIRKTEPILGGRFVARGVAVCAVAGLLMQTAAAPRDVELPQGVPPVSVPTAVAAEPNPTVTEPSSQEVPVPAVPTPPTAPGVEATEDSVKFSVHGTVTIAAQNVEISSLLELLSVRSNRNIIASNLVKGTVSVNLFDVPFDQALEAILSVNGLVSQTEANFTKVYTSEEFAVLEQKLHGKETRVFVVEYLSATDVIEFLKPIVSKDGSIAARGSAEPNYEPSVDDGGGDEYAYSTKVVVTDYPKTLDRIAETLKALDVSPQQVRIECTVLLAEVGEDNAFSVDFSWVNNLDFTSLTTPLAPVTDMKDGVVSTNNATAGQATNSAGLIGDKNPTLQMGLIANNIAVFISALDEVTDTTVMARPNLTCLNRQKGQVLIGERVPYLNTTQNQTTTTQTVEFLDVGVKMIVRPFITPEGMIRMDLYPSVSSARSVTLDSAGGKATVPQETTRELQTNVRVKSGQTIVLGGLFTEDTTVKRRSMPFFGDIPILGAAFQGKEDKVSRKEIIFLITPTVVADEIAAKEGEDALQVIEAVRVGQRAGLLPFSREQTTDNLQRMAFEAYQNGDTKQALHFARAARRLKPVMPAMIMMEERIESGPNSKFADTLQSILDTTPAFSDKPGDPEIKGEGAPK